MPALARSATALAVETFRADADGGLDYLVVDAASGAALAIDPRLDQVDRFRQVLAARGARLVYALDTHTHADHLSGVRRLAEATGAAVLAHARAPLRGPVRRIEGGETLALGATSIAVLDTPGHTPDSLSLLVEGHLFTGDALFAGGAGRTDFPGGSASDLFDTLRTFEALPDATIVHPGHDYTGHAVTTIGQEKSQNSLLREHDRGALVARLSGAATPPANMEAILRHNRGEAGAATIAPQEFEALRRRGAAPLIVDVRSALEFESEHIEEARLVPFGELESRIDEIPDSAEVVLVCRTGIRATIAADALGRAGRRARVLDGGMNAWRRAGLPVREGRKRLPVDRQVQLIAGSMVLTGVVLGALVNPWFLGLAAFFGGGLVFAGATGTCGLALVLMKLPWNRPLGIADGAPGASCAAVSSGPSSCAAPSEPGR